jgi:hypothetical protein
MAKPALLVDLIAQATKGKKDDLFRKLELGSGLPGPRANLKLALEFAETCAHEGASTDALIHAMANEPPTELRGEAAKEFLAMCGVLAVAARAVKEPPLRDQALVILEERTDDPRFRVRDTIPLALAMLGTKMHADLAERLEPWMDRYFHATAVIRALADRTWLETFGPKDGELPIRLVDEAFYLAANAPRSDLRYPGHKALVEALHTVPKAFAKRFGMPMFDQLAVWAPDVKMPELRDVILANLDDAQLKKPFANEIRKIKALVESSKAPPRDPSKIIAGMRSRGKKRDRR